MNVWTQSLTRFEAGVTRGFLGWSFDFFALARSSKETETVAWGVPFNMPPDSDFMVLTLTNFHLPIPADLTGPPRGDGARQAGREASQNSVSRIAHSNSVLVRSGGRDGPLDYCSRPILDALARSRGEKPGSARMEALHPVNTGTALPPWRDAVAARWECTIEFRARRADETYRRFRTRSSTLPDRRGRFTRWSVTATANDDGRSAEQDARFLVEPSEALASLTDETDALQKLSRLAVPLFTDWCAADTLADDGLLDCLAVAHVVPAEVTLGYDLYRQSPKRDEFGLEAVLIDIGMPGINGHEVVPRRRLCPASGDMILRVLAGPGQESDRRSSCVSTIDNSLVKPIKPRLVTEASCASYGG